MPTATQMLTYAYAGKVADQYSQADRQLRPVFGRLPEPNRAWLLAVYFSC